MTNNNLAQRVLDYIADHPEKHRQTTFWDWSPSRTADLDRENLPETICGTTMCIAGTAIYLNGGVAALRAQVPVGNWVRVAADLLGISYQEADALFYTMDNAQAIEALEAIVARDKARDDFSEASGRVQELLHLDY